MELEGLKVLTYIVGITSLIMALLALITVIAQTLLSSKLTSQPNTTENINITVTHQTNYGQPMKLELNYPSQDGVVSDDEINAIIAKLMDRIKNGPSNRHPHTLDTPLNPLSRGDFL